MATAIKDIQEDPRELALQEKVATGYQLEDVEEMTERYKNVLAELDQVQKMETVHLNAFLSKQTLAGKREYVGGTESPRSPGRATVVV